MIGTEEVLEARNCASGSSASSRLNISRLAASSSMIASIAASAPSTSSSDVGEGEALERVVAVLLGACPPARRGRATSRSPRATCSARSSSTSTHGHVDARAGADLGDPRAHEAATDHSDSHGRHAICAAPIASTRRRSRRRPRERAAERLRGFGRRGTGTTQTQLGSLVEPGRTIRPAPRSAAACRATLRRVLPVVEVLRHRRLASVRIDVDHVVHGFSAVACESDEPSLV